MTNIKDLRESQGIALQFVADQLGVTAKTYRKYEADPRNTMTLAQADRVLELLHEKPVHIFLTNEGN